MEKEIPTVVEKQKLYRYMNENNSRKETVITPAFLENEAVDFIPSPDHEFSEEELVNQLRNSAKPSNSCSELNQFLVLQR